MPPEEQDTGVPEEEPSLRDDIEAAVAQVEAEYPGEEAQDGSQTPAAKPAPEAAAGEGAAAPEASAEGSGEAPAAATGGEPAYPDDGEKYPNLETKLGKAPAGWRPAAREGWDALPEQVRREIHRRELDIATGQQQTAEARHFQRDVMAVLGPHEALMRKEGAETPAAAIKGLVDTAVVLDQGTPTQKAQRLVQLISHYGVDVKELDGALAAHYRGNGGAPPPAPAITQELDKRLEPIQQFMSTLQERLNAVGEQEAEAARGDIEAFQENAEFLADVRLDMADLLDMASERGRPMSLQQAYDAACNLNPEIREIIAKRAAQTAQETTQQRVASKVDRSKALMTGKQAGTGPQQSNGSLREDIERAFDSVTGG